MHKFEPFSAKVLNGISAVAMAKRCDVDRWLSRCERDLCRGDLSCEQVNLKADLICTHNADG